MVNNQKKHNMKKKIMIIIIPFDCKEVIKDKNKRYSNPNMKKDFKFSFFSYVIPVDQMEQ